LDKTAINSSCGVSHPNIFATDEIWVIVSDWPMCQKGIRSDHIIMSTYVQSWLVGGWITFLQFVTAKKKCA